MGRLIPQILMHFENYEGEARQDYLGLFGKPTFFFGAIVWEHLRICRAGLGLGWIGLCWASLGLARLGCLGLAWIGPGWLVLRWVWLRSFWLGLGCAGLDWAGLCMQPAEVSPRSPSHRCLLSLFLSPSCSLVLSFSG